MTDVAAEPEESAPPVAQYLLAGAATSVVLGAALVVTARIGSTPLLVAIAVVQALLACAWVLGTGMPGRRGGLIVGALAAAGADVGVEVWPHDRLGALLPALGLAVPAMFVHQLTRGTARTAIVSSLSATSLLVAAEVALPAALQLRHEFSDGALAGRAAAALVGAAAAALAVGYLVDTLVATPRFDAEVPRGGLALLSSIAVGVGVSYLQLRGDKDFAEGRALFVGGALGAAVALLAVGSAFVLHTTPVPESRLPRALRPVLAASVPLCVVAPAGFLLFLAVRS